LLLDGLLQVVRHRRNGYARHLHRAVARLLDDDVEGAELGGLLGIVLAEVPPRLSLRSIAESVIASDTESRFRTSIAVCQPE